MLQAAKFISHLSFKLTQKVVCLLIVIAGFTACSSDQNTEASQAVQSLLEESRQLMDNDIITAYKKLNAAKIVRESAQDNQLIAALEGDLYSKAANHPEYQLGYIFLGNSRSNDANLFESDIMDSDKNIVSNLDGFQQYSSYITQQGNRGIFKALPINGRIISEIPVLNRLPANFEFFILDSIYSIKGDRLNDTKYWAETLVEKGSNFENFLIDISNAAVDFSAWQEEVIKRPDNNYYLVVLTYSEPQYAYQQLENLMQKGFSNAKILYDQKPSTGSRRDAATEERRRHWAEVLFGKEEGEKRYREARNNNKDYFYLIALEGGFSSRVEGEKALERLLNSYQFIQTPYLFQYK